MIFFLGVSWNRGACACFAWDRDFRSVRFIHIRFVWLVFLTGIVFFSHNNSARTVLSSQFQPRFSEPNGLIIPSLGKGFLAHAHCGTLDCMHCALSKCGCTVHFVLSKGEEYIVYVCTWSSSFSIYNTVQEFIPCTNYWVFILSRERCTVCQPTATNCMLVDDKAYRTWHVGSLSHTAQYIFQQGYAWTMDRYARMHAW